MRLLQSSMHLIQLVSITNRHGADLNKGGGPKSYISPPTPAFDSEKFSGVIGQFLFNGLAMVARVGLLLATAMWLTSKGLQTNTNLARISAFARLLLKLLPSIVPALSMRNPMSDFMLLIIAICGLGMDALCTPQVTQPH